MAGRSCLQPAVPESPVLAKRQPQAGIRDGRGGVLLGLQMSPGPLAFLEAHLRSPSHT